MSMTTPRNRSTRYQDHEGLLRKKAKLYYSRLLAAQIMGVDFDDVMGELGVAFTRAAAGYDPQSEYVFTTYLGRCCQNHFNKYAAKLMLEQFGTEAGCDLELGLTNRGLGYISIEALSPNDAHALDVMADEGATPGEQIDAGIAIANIINDASLLPETRAYIGAQVNPDLKLSPAIQQRILSRQQEIRKEVQERWGVRLTSISL